MIQRPWRSFNLSAHRRAAIAGTLLAILVIALAVAPTAAAGTYRAVQCHPGLGAGRADAGFQRNSPRYGANVDCDRKGLGITHEAGPRPTASGRFGAWTLAAPAGVEIVRASAAVSAAGAGWHSPQMFVAMADGARRMLAHVRGEIHPVRWAGSAGRAVGARLICTHDRRCGPGRRAHIHLKRVALALRDLAAPSVKPAGTLLAPGSRRGLQALQVGARDAGSGVRALTIEVNDDPLAARVLDCRLAGTVAVRLRPCPASETSRFELATTSRHFRQGPNRLRVCAVDYSPRADANRACASRTVRIDNLCPVSESPGAVLRARFRGARKTLSVRSDRPAVVTGALRDTAGTPVAGARVCVAVRPHGSHSAERVLATPITNARGAFAVRVPAGSSREIRVAHWPSGQRALERHLTLRARAIPRLDLRPRRPLANGERLRFGVAIPGPANARRRVVIQARADDRWIRIAGGRTSRAGVWSGRYRFRSTTGTRRYAFRALVPRQRGYPYESGRSRIAHATVVGSRAAAKSEPG